MLFKKKVMEQDKEDNNGNIYFVFNGNRYYIHNVGSLYSPVFEIIEGTKNEI